NQRSAIEAIDGVAPDQNSSSFAGVTPMGRNAFDLIFQVIKRSPHRRARQGTPNPFERLFENLKNHSPVQTPKFTNGMCFGDLLGAGAHDAAILPKFPLD